MSRSTRFLAIPTLLALATLAACDQGAGRTPDLAPIRAAATRITPLHAKKKRPPGSGDWLDAHKEAGQTFDQYRAANPNGPTAKRTTLYVQPLGAFDPAQARLLNDTAELLAIFYSLPVKKLDPLELALIPASARRRRAGREQILSTAALRTDTWLAAQRPTGKTTWCRCPTGDPAPSTRIPTPSPARPPRTVTPVASRSRITAAPPAAPPA